MYVQEYQCLPYDSRGEEFALFRLSNVLNSNPAYWSDRQIPFEYDETKEIAVDLRIMYLNPKPTAQFDPENPVIICLAPAGASNSKQVWLLDSNGYAYCYENLDVTARAQMPLIGKDLLWVRQHGQEVWRHIPKKTIMTQPG